MRSKRMPDAAVLRAAERIEAKKDRRYDSELATLRIRFNVAVKTRKWTHEKAQRAWVDLVYMLATDGLETALAALDLNILKK